MDLNILWYLLIAILYIGFFILDGFDFGVGILLPFLTKDDTERRMIINTIGPHWDANEVWLITAGGATFAAFPHWYATMFSGLYPALFLLLVGLILRGVAFEFRSKDDNPLWRTLWDWAIFIGSFLGALLFGVAFANLFRGLPIDENMVYTGGFWYLLNPFGLLGGLMGVVGFLFHGSLYLSLKTEGELLGKVKALINKLWIAAMVVFALLFVGGFVFTATLGSMGVALVLPVLSLVALGLAGMFARQEKYGLGFVMSALAILFVFVTHFWGGYPNVMLSTTNPAFSLTIYNAASSQYTLKIMAIVAAIFVPIMLAYQVWVYKVFGNRVSADPKELEY